MYSCLHPRPWLSSVGSHGHRVDSARNSAPRVTRHGRHGLYGTLRGADYFDSRMRPRTPPKAKKAHLPEYGLREPCQQQGGGFCLDRAGEHGEPVAIEEFGARAPSDHKEVTVDTTHRRYLRFRLKGPTETKHTGRHGSERQNPIFDKLEASQTCALCPCVCVCVVAVGRGAPRGGRHMCVGGVHRAAHKHCARPDPPKYIVHYRVGCDKRATAHPS